MPGFFVEMVFHPGAAGKHPVPPMWSRIRPGALLPTTSGESDPGHGSKAQRVSFKLVYSGANRRLTVYVGPISGRNAGMGLTVKV